MVSPRGVLFCTLCLRECPRDLAVWIAVPSQHQLTYNRAGQNQMKLVELWPKLEGRAICRSCWQLVELLADFKEKNSDDVTTCGECCKKFNARSGSVHKQLCGAFRIQSTTRSPYRCSICLVDLLVPSQLDAHLNKHKGFKPYKCRKVCGRFFYGRLGRLNHEKKCGRMIKP